LGAEPAEEAIKEARPEDDRREDRRASRPGPLLATGTGAEGGGRWIADPVAEAGFDRVEFGERTGGAAGRASVGSPSGSRHALLYGRRPRKIPRFLNRELSFCWY
jgi:hypothetical protein